MFKNIIMYRLDANWNSTAEKVEESLQAGRFVECGASQEKSIGWVEPRRQPNGPLLEAVAGQWIAKLMVETRAVPASVINRKAQERVAQIEDGTGRKPGKKETRDLKDDIRLELLPMAFTKQSSVLVWIDRDARLLVIDAASQARADEVVTLLVQALPGFAVTLINTQVSPVAAMAEWLLTQEAPAGFTVDRECELKACDESKAVVKYGKHRLDIDEVPDHIRAGKMPTKLAMTWGDRVSFMLTEGLQLKKLAFLDGVFESTSANHKKDDDFDGDVTISTGELQKLLPDVLEALGGESAVQANEGSSNDKSGSDEDGTTSNPPAPHLGSHIDGPDPLYDKAVEVVLKNQKASISLVQRHLTIGYNRAARLLEDMEKAGIVSPMKTSGQREILKTACEVVA